MLSIPGIGQADVEKVIDMIDARPEPDLPIEDSSNLIQQIISVLGVTATDASLLSNPAFINTLMEIIYMKVATISYRTHMILHAKGQRRRTMPSH